MRVPFDLGAAEDRNTVDRVQAGEIQKPTVDIQETNDRGRPVGRDVDPDPGPEESDERAPGDPPHARRAAQCSATPTHINVPSAS